MAVTLRFQTSGRVPGRADPIRMRGRSMTLGRAPENDVVLPDPDQLISKRHCVIEDHGGRIVVLDLSTNGTFLNYGKVPLGRMPTPLNDGDVLSVGPYELVVGISDLDLPDPLDLPPLGAEDEPLPPLGEERGPAARPRPDLPGDPLGDDVDFLDRLLGDVPPAGPSQVRRPDLADDGLLPPLSGVGGLLGPGPDSDHRGASRADHGDPLSDSFRPARAADLIPDDLDLGDLLPGFPDKGPPPPPAPAPAPRHRNPFADDPPVPAETAAPTLPAAPGLPVERHEPPSRAATAPPAAPPAPVPGDAAARAFLAAFGAADVPVSDAQLLDTMTRLGTAMGIMVQGLREVLMTRSAIKSEFRIQQTMISAGGNNPLKFSVSPEQAVEALVRPPGRGYLDAATAAAQALDDIRAHEMAMMSGLEAALKGILHKLSPQALESRLDSGGGLGSLLKGRKARYWEVYEKMYAEIAGQAADDFHDLFAREFARAYQQQMDLLKASDAGSTGTVSKGQSHVVG